MALAVKPAGPVIIEIDGFDAVMKLFDADSATISANAVGLPPTASARLIARGTITMVAPPWLIPSENSVVSNDMARLIIHTSRPSGTRVMLFPATRPPAPPQALAPPRGLQPAKTN